METSSLIKYSVGCLLLLTVACGESHDLEPEDFDDVTTPALSDAGAGPSARLDAGAGGLLGGLLDPNVIGGLLGNLGGGAGPQPDAGRGPNNGPSDAAVPPMARDAAVANPACVRYPQLPICPRDAGAADAGRDAAAGDAGQDAGPSDGAVGDGALGDAGSVDASADAGDAGATSDAALDAS